MFHPFHWMGSVLVIHSCLLHICYHPCGLYSCCVCVVIVINVVMSPCETKGVVVEFIVMSALGPYNTNDYPITIVVIPLINIFVPIFPPYCYYCAP